MLEPRSFQKIEPSSLLKNLANARKTAQLIVDNGSVSWSIYFQQGRVVFASHSIDPFERLGRHLSQLGHRDLAGFNSDRARLNTTEATTAIPEIKLISKWFNSEVLQPAEVKLLVERLNLEVVGSLLLVKSGQYRLSNQIDLLPTFCALELQSVLSYCQSRFDAWKLLAPIGSPYQRPNLSVVAKNRREFLQHLPSDLVVRLNGFNSLYHLATLTNKDELQLALDLHSYVLEGLIGLHDPHPPFDKLPRINYRQLTPTGSKTLAQLNSSFRRHPLPLREITSASVNQVAQNPASQKHDNTRSNNNYPPQLLKLAAQQAKPIKIACVDDSLSMLSLIKTYLESDNFVVDSISDPVKALMQIFRLKPDCILLDVNMASLNGYELCRLIRNHPRLKTIPIIMVTGNTGIINRTRAKLMGASGYITKPFNQADLLKVIFQHIT
jgi:twitching motility two-component system response regulator PilG